MERLVRTQVVSMNAHQDQGDSRWYCNIECRDQHTGERVSIRVYANFPEAARELADYLGNQMMLSSE